MKILAASDIHSNQLLVERLADKAEKEKVKEGGKNKYSSKSENKQNSINSFIH